MGENNGMRPADFAAMTNGNDFGGNGAWWFLAMFIIFIFGGGGWGNWNNGSNSVLDSTLAASAAQGGFVTSNQLNDALRLQTIQQGQRDLASDLSQNKYDIVNAQAATESRLTSNQANLLANQAANAQMMQTCCAQIQANCTANSQKVLDAIHQDKIERLQNKVAEQGNTISQLQQNAFIQQQLAPINRGVDMTTKYPNPNAYSYSAGPNPFCGCGCTNM